MNLKVFILTFLSLTTITNAWWDVGHMLTARIAQIRLAQLSPFAAVQFRDLVKSINKLCDDKSQTLVESACWPDDLKAKQYSMNLWDSWHFIDSPYTMDGVFPVINFTEVAVSSVNVMNIASKVLKTNSLLKTAERALYARYAIHLVGDIHQPLHSVALYNQTYKSGDRGGNLLKIKMLNGTLMNFHSFWDSGAFRIQNESWFMVRPLSDANLSALTSEANAMIAKYGRQVEILGQNIIPTDWALQSLRIATNTTYKRMLETNIADEEYTSLVYETSRKRITLAGYRLANFVIDVYTNSTLPEQQSSNEMWKKMMKQVRIVNGLKHKQYQQN